MAIMIRLCGSVSSNIATFPNQSCPVLLSECEQTSEDIRDGGLVLNFEDRTFGSTRAVVRADENAKRIYIAVGGKQKRDYFSAIRKSINDINRSFEKLSVTELVPLPDVSDILIDYREL